LKQELINLGTDEEKNLSFLRLLEEELESLRSESKEIL
jgi:hypothetical protein